MFKAEHGNLPVIQHSDAEVSGIKDESVITKAENFTLNDRNKVDADNYLSL
jgi:hypothetical protein